MKNFIATSIQRTPKTTPALAVSGSTQRTCRDFATVKRTACPQCDLGRQPTDRTVRLKLSPPLLAGRTQLFARAANNTELKGKMNLLLLKRYPHITALVAVILLAALLVCLGTPVAGALLIVALWQLSQLALSKRRAACFIPMLTEAQIEEFGEIVRGLEREYSSVKGLPARLASLETHHDNLKKEIARLQKQALTAMGGGTGVRWVGNQPFVSDDCASALTSVFVLDATRIKGALESLIPEESRRQQVVSMARGFLGASTKAALSDTEIPLPTAYVPQIIELVFRFGQARQYATVFPLGTGTVKLPRLKAGEDDFGFLGVGTGGMSQNVTEKKVTAELVTFTANKAGGLLRIPYELGEDTFIPIGQFLARYIARQFAKLEDSTLFLGDGTSSYANITGVDKYCSTNGYNTVLASGKTSPNDVTLDDFRAMRGKVNAAVLANMNANGETEAAYYLHPSYEPLLRSFNAYPNFVVFTNDNGKPKFDGWPVRWIGVGQVNTQNAAASATVARFGDLSYWFLGERGAPRIEISRDVFFATDELAMRALERIDVECMGIDAMATLQTAAS